MVSKKEREILRELARRYMELANLDINEARRKRCADINNLKSARPVIWIDEIPWHEINGTGELDLFCEDAFLREIEWFFRSRLFQWNYFQADMVLTPYYPLQKSSGSSGFGVEIQEEVLETDGRNSIVSHSYGDRLDTEEKVEKLHIPVLWADPEEDDRKKAAAQEILGDLMPVRLCGTYACFQPWDELAKLRGVEPLLMDMIERPEFIHQIMEKMTEIGLSAMEQQERLGLLDAEPVTLHCTPPYRDGASDSVGSGPAKLDGVWFRGAAQILGSVSPAMFDEFELQYIRPLAEKCGLTYYGCCEPLDSFLPHVKKIGNLRKVGVSPWANQEKCAEQIGKDYVFARKPNPAAVALSVDEDAVYREIHNTLKICDKYGCALEFVLKDISTVSGRLENLIRWNRAAKKAVDDFYG